MSTENFPAGIKVQIVNCEDFPCAVGRWATVCKQQDQPGRIKVSFDDKWQGYFAPEQLVTISKMQRELLDLIKDRNGIQTSLSELTDKLQKVNRQIFTMCHKYKLCPECGAPVVRIFPPGLLFREKWACSDSHCSGSFIE